MATYLSLCQDVARESGTISGSSQPSSVVSQTGRLAQVVSWTAVAWTRIQNLHASWKWMREEFSKNTSSGTARYTAAGWSLTDWAEWITEDHSVTIYKSSLGVSDEGELTRIDWIDWRRMYGRGTQTNGRPSHYAVSPNNEFCLGPIPDDTYVVNAEYRRTPQVLSANADEPECPSRFHQAIVWLGVQMVHEADEAPPQAIVSARVKYMEILSEMERDQLPRIEIGAAPLA